MSHSLPKTAHPANLRRRRILIYDSALSGHHPDYLHAVLDYARTLTDTDCHFLVPAAFVDGLESVASGNISFRALSTDESEKIAALETHAKARFELQLITAELDDAAQAEQPFDECVLMYLDYFQAALASDAGKRFPVNIAGVLFQPYTRVENVATTGSVQIGLLFKAIRKRYRLSRMLRAGRVKRICVPGDTRAAAMLERRHRQYATFTMLPEPYFPDPDLSERETQADATPPALNIRRKYGIDPEKRVVLVFGRIIPRKNVPRIIDAFAVLDEGAMAATVLLVLGTAEAQYQAQLQQCVERACAANPRLQIVYDHDYADQSLVEAAFAQCDLVAMPYLKAYQSSGVLFLAARHRKPVLASDVGLINELVEQFDLGLTVNVQDTQALAEAISLALSKQFFSASAEEFLLRHTPQSHASVILGLYR